MDSSASDLNNDEEMTNSESSANVYTNYNQFSNANEQETESSDNDWKVSGKNKKAVPKAQVFTSYVQSNEREGNKKYQTANKHNQQSYHQRNDTNKKEPIKKPKMDSLNTVPKEVGIVDESLIDSCFSTCIGLQTFESAAKNIFTDFIENDLILVCLDSRQQFKNKFCFKGKCKFTLIHGQININGYDIKSSQLLDSQNESSGWFDLYSPETNSYLSLSNAQTIETNSNQMDENQNETLAKKIIFKCNLNIDNSLYLKLKEFIIRNEFSTGSSSLFALKNLKSQICDYLSYYDNFHHLYQSGIGLTKQQDFDSKLAKIGIFPVDAENFGAIKIERTEEKQITKEILESSDGTHNICLFLHCLYFKLR